MGIGYSLTPAGGWKITGLGTCVSELDVAELGVGGSGVGVGGVGGGYFSGSSPTALIATSVYPATLLNEEGRRKNRFKWNCGGDVHQHFCQKVPGIKPQAPQPKNRPLRLRIEFIKGGMACRLVSEMI